MSDQFTETTTSWGKRLSQSLSGVIIGFALFLASFALLWMNEDYSVQRIKILDNAQKTTVEALATPVDPSNDSKLVHIIGPATTPDILGDNLFGVRENALKLKRKIEMYQWKETETSHTTTNFGGSQTRSATYSYKKTWVEGRVDSTHFKQPEGHENPKTMPYGSQTWIANIHIGAFQPSKEFINKIDDFKDYPLTPENYAAMNNQLKNYFKLNGDQYFYGDPANPEIGAMRVHYQIIRPTDISVIGRQDKNTLSPYDTRDPNGVPQPIPPTTQPKSFKQFLTGVWDSINARAASSTDTIDLLQMGDVTMQVMLATALHHNETVTWSIRAGGSLLMWFGLMFVLNPIKVLADFIPPIGSLVGMSIGLVTGLIALALSLITIAAAWIYYRPLTVSLLLLLAVAAIYGIVHHIRKIKNRNLTGIAPVAQ